MIEVNFQEMKHTYIHTIKENSTTHVDNEFMMYNDNCVLLLKIWR